MDKFRIQPKDIDIPPDYPFEHDLLDRQKLIKSLTHLVGSTEGPCVMAVDAPWGAGKTTFLKMWSQHLRNQAFTVVDFNAWETDFSNDPFMALCAELTRGLDTEEGDKPSERTNQLKETAQVIFRHVTSNAVRHLSMGFVDLKAIEAGLSERPAETPIEERLEAYQEVKDAFATFRKALQDIATELPGARPLIVMIDELDRCRPTYAVELLETAKHLFAVDQVVFVLAVNREQQAHAVKGLYGNEFDAEIYLRRFFDLYIHLPEPYLENFINNLFVSMGLEDNDWFERLLKPFFSAASLSLRDIAQTVHRHGLVLKSLPDINTPVARMTAVALLLRMFNEPLYHRFAGRDISDLEIADKIFENSSITHL